MEYYQQLPQIPQRTPEWYQKKATILSSTQIASVLHLNSYHSHQELLEKDLNEPHREPVEVNRRNASDIDPITWGTILEPIAIQHLEQSTQKPVGELGLKVHDHIPYLGASPDGIQIVNSRPRLVEIKCPKKRQITYRVPLEYWVQVQIAMEVWDINETLYCEYKFDITTESPTTRDLTVTYGELARGVYWIYQDSWTYLIQRDRAWFQKVQAQINEFYQLKFVTKEPPKDLILPTTKCKILKDKKRKRASSEQGQAKRQRFREKEDEDELLEQSMAAKRHRADPDRDVESDEEPVTERKSVRRWMPINRLSNFLREDPILDWLEVHGADYGFEKEKSLFLDFYNQQNLSFKLETFKDVLRTAQQAGLSYRILNKSVSNLIDISQKNNLLLKLPYDCRLVRRTQEIMQAGQTDVIFMGQLSREIDGYHFWDTFDLIVRKSAMDKLFPNHAFLEVLPTLPEFNVAEFIPIKIKLTTLDFRKGGPYLRSKHKVDQFKVGFITSALLMDRHGDFGVFTNHNDLDQIREGLNWLKEVDQHDTLDNLYPNMKNRYDSQWSSAKSEIAEEKEELTQVSYLTVESRKALHAKNIFRISELTPDDVTDLKYASRIMPFINEELDLPKITLPHESPIEVYLDFESCTSLGTGESLIFMMGVLVKRGEQDPEYTPYLVENLDKRSETKMISEGLHFLRLLGPNIPIFHWSAAEPNLLRRAGWELPKNCYWVDLYQHFVKNHASIPGCYTYGLKDVASALYKLKKIQSRWLHGLDGNTAMTMAWNINHKCEITGERFNQDPRIRKLCDYNYVDCLVCEEIRRLL